MGPAARPGSWLRAKPAPRLRPPARAALGPGGGADRHRAATPRQPRRAAASVARGRVAPRPRQSPRRPASTRRRPARRGGGVPRTARGCSGGESRFRGRRGRRPPRRADARSGMRLAERAAAPCAVARPVESPSGRGRPFADSSRPAPFGCRPIPRHGPWPRRARQQDRRHAPAPSFQQPSTGIIQPSVSFVRWLPSAETGAALGSTARCSACRRGRPRIGDPQRDRPDVDGPYRRSPRLVARICGSADRPPVRRMPAIRYDGAIAHRLPERASARRAAARPGRQVRRRVTRRKADTRACDG